MQFSHVVLATARAVRRFFSGQAGRLDTICFGEIGVLRSERRGDGLPVGSADKQRPHP